MKVLITGGEQGLGKGILRLLKSQCHEVVNIEGRAITDSVAKDSLKEFIDSEIGDYNPDWVINNYGTNSLSWIGQTNRSDRDVLEINTMLPYWVVNALVANGSVCRVLNVSSQTYKTAQRTTSLYCASKAATAHMTKVMARELAPKGWVVNSFAPGKILGTKMTEMTDQQVMDIRGWSKEEADGYATALVPMGRFMDIDEAASIAVSILEMESYVNGSVIDAFGGV